MLLEQQCKIVAGERRLSGQHFEQAASERIQIGLAGDPCVASNLFRSHVTVCTNRHTAGSQIGVGQISGDPKIAKLQFGIPVEKQDFPVSSHDGRRRCCEHTVGRCRFGGQVRQRPTSASLVAFATRPLTVPPSISSIK